MREPHSHSSPLPLLAQTQGGRQTGRHIIEMNHPLQCSAVQCRSALDVCGLSGVCNGVVDVSY